MTTRKNPCPICNHDQELTLSQRIGIDLILGDKGWREQMDELKVDDLTITVVKEKG